MAKKIRSEHFFVRRDFFKIKKKFSKISTDLIKFEVATSNNTYAKLGITVSRKYGNAVARNRFKRLVREAFRANRPQMPTGAMVHVLAKRQKTLTFKQIVSDFNLLMASFLTHGSKSPSLSRTP